MIGGSVRSRGFSEGDEGSVRALEFSEVQSL